MAKKRKKTNGNFFERVSQTITGFTGSTTAFVIAFATIIIWAVTGPIFNYSDTWQLVINTGTTIVTFLMVFLIQRTQNKDSLAMQMKLNEIVAAIKGASNRLVDVEDLSEEDLKILHKHYQTLADMAGKEQSLHNSHSVEEAKSRTKEKMKSEKKEKK
ncbi:MAG: low affinity iron permease family protein [Ignavibacteriae bacterium]|nr:MAG: low affinity iron permease family protein [Ignavibacteriota bacterium]